MAVKVTAFFNQDKYAWSEIHYLNVAFSAELEGNPTVSQYLQLRANCLGLGASLNNCRVSSVPGDQFVADSIFAQNLVPHFFTPNPILGLPPTPLTVGNAPFYYFAQRAPLCVMTRLISRDGGHRNYYMAGAPAGIFRTVPGTQNGIDLTQPSQWVTAYDALMSFLAVNNNGFGWMTRTQSTLIRAAGPPVTSAAYPGMIGIQVPNNLPVLPGGEVYVKGWRRISVPAGRKLSGVYTLGAILPPVSPSLNFTYFLMNTAQVSPTNFKTVGSIAALELTFEPYASFGELLATSRKRGATEYRPKGRRALSSF